ncbi:MAG: ribosomal protein S18-alanine N-acetyltransferase [bacterium]
MKTMPPVARRGISKELFGFNGIEIRAMADADIHDVVEIEKRGQSAPWSEKQFYDEVKLISVSTPMVAVIEKQIVGFAVPWYVGDEIDLTNIGVDPKFRRQGVATKLLQRIVQKGEQGKFHRIHLEVRKSNTGAISFYQKFGFRETGIRQQYYPDTREDAVLMVCDPDIRKY